MELQRGMRVIVRSDLNVETLRDFPRCSFTPEMDKTLGQKGVIASITFSGNHSVNFDDKSLNRGKEALWSYRAMWLLPYVNEVTVVEED